MVKRRKTDKPAAPPIAPPAPLAVVQDAEEEDASEWPPDDEAGCWEDDLEPFDLYKTLGVTRASGKNGGVAGGESRIRSQFHRKSLRYHPEHFKPQRSGNRVPVVQQRSEANLNFRRVGLAFSVLMDPARREVYDAAGWAGLKQSEGYSEENVFDWDAFDIFEHFFSGESEGDRQYLLMESIDGGRFSDSEEEAEDEAEEGGEEEEEGDEDEQIARLLKQEKEKEQSRAATARKPTLKKTADERAFPTPPGSLIMATPHPLVGNGPMGPPEPQPPGLENGDVWKRLKMQIETPSPASDHASSQREPR